MAWIRGAWLCALLAATGCPDNPTPSDATGSSGPGATTSATGTTAVTPSESTSTTAAADSTSGDDDDTSATSATSDDATTTGSPAGQGHIRLLMRAGGRLGAGSTDLSVYDYDEGRVDQSTVHRALDEGRLVQSFGLSAARTFVHYKTIAERRDDERAFIAGYADGSTDAALRINTAPAPAPGLVGPPQFTSDDGTAAFFASASEGGPGIWLSDTTNDAAPVLAHPALGSGDDVTFSFAVGPAGVAITGDFSGSDLNNLYLASSDPAVAGPVTQLTFHADPAQRIAPASIGWTPDGSGLIYRADADIDGLNELWWVAATGRAAPVRIHTPLARTDALSTVRLAPDGRAVAYRVTTDAGGEIYVADLDGKGPSAAVRVSTPTDGAAFSNSLIWSADSDGLIYTAEHNTPGKRDAYFVDMSGATPGTPERINSELAAGGAVVSVVFGPDGDYLYYVAPQAQAAAELFRAPLVDQVPGVTERISGPLTDGGSLSGEMVFAPDGSALLYTGNADDADHTELFLLSLGRRTGAAIKVNAELDPGFDVQSASRFSADGSMIAYRVRAQDATTATLLVEDLTDGPANPIAVDESVQGFVVLPTR